MCGIQALDRDRTRRSPGPRGQQVPPERDPATGSNRPARAPGPPPALALHNLPPAQWTQATAEAHWALQPSSRSQAPWALQPSSRWPRKCGDRAQDQPPRRSGRCRNQALARTAPPRPSRTGSRGRCRNHALAQTAPPRPAGAQGPPPGRDPATGSNRPAGALGILPPQGDDPESRTVARPAAHQASQPASRQRANKLQAKPASYQATG